MDVKKATPRNHSLQRRLVEQQKKLVDSIASDEKNIKKKPEEPIKKKPEASIIKKPEAPIIKKPEAPIIKKPDDLIQGGEFKLFNRKASQGTLHDSIP